MIHAMGMLMGMSWPANGPRKNILCLYFDASVHASGHFHAKGRQMNERYLPKNTLLDTKEKQLLPNIYYFTFSEHV
jgi:hypothetical protein